MAAATGTKRKRKVITLEKKLTIIDQLSKGSSQGQVLKFQSPLLETYGRPEIKLKSMCLSVVLKKYCIIKDAQYEDRI